MMAADPDLSVLKPGADDKAMHLDHLLLVLNLLNLLHDAQRRALLLQ